MEKYCTVQQATDDNTIQRMCFACWVPKATSTPQHCQETLTSKHTFSIFNNYFSLQERLLSEYAKMLRYASIATF